MQVDLGNCLAGEADPGVSRDSLERLDEAVAAAHDRISTGRRNDEFGYAALNLPEATTADAIRSAAAPVVDAEYVLTVGIGGSALGAKTVTRGLGLSGHYVLDNIDPDHVQAVLDDLDLAKTVVNVVSRSGRTTETIANFLLVRNAFDAAGVDWTSRTIVTTGEDGPLRALGERHNIPILDPPVGVPGRFSVFSVVGLVPAAILGGDIDGILAGARSAAEELSGSVFDCPAYAYGTTIDALARRGATVNVMMPYAESLEPFAEWFAQLWAESLGKDGVGEIPVRALGATDQHSQLQLYRGGPRDAVVTLVRPRERGDVAVPAGEFDGVEYLEGVSLAGVLDAEFRATEASLASVRRPSLRVEINRVDGLGLGRLLYGMEAACVLAAELKGVNAFDQPAVEWGKRATRRLLAGDDTKETQAIADKKTLVVGSVEGG